MTRATIGSLQVLDTNRRANRRRARFCTKPITSELQDSSRTPCQYLLPRTSRLLAFSIRQTESRSRVQKIVFPNHSLTGLHCLCPHLSPVMKQQSRLPKSSRNPSKALQISALSTLRMRQVSPKVVLPLGAQCWALS